MTNEENTIEYWETQKRLFPHSANVLGGHIDISIAALQAQAERDNPKPLSLEELRGMDGEPVYFVEHEKIWHISAWVLCIKPENDWFRFITVSMEPMYRNAKNYGKTWLAYHYKPKEAN